MHTHKKINVTVDSNFTQKFAEKYLEQRSQTQFDYSDKELYENLGFGTDVLKDIISKNAVPVDTKREQGLQPTIFNDIYRSDLGELLMTYYFEEKLPEGERFIIPLKNITFRERAELPGRGLDAIGYRRISDGQIEILLGEAKVSADRNSPPAVVDSNDDSLYKTHLKHKNDVPTVMRRLTDYARRLNAKDAAAILGFVILSTSTNKNSPHISTLPITYGCTLIRDHTCVNEDTDFGKLKSKSVNFEPNKVHFSILSFSNKSIEETVDLFYQKVQELIAK
jgi:hypothetical protein